MSTSENSLIAATGDGLGVQRASVASAGMLYDDWVVAETEATLALAAWRTAARSRKRAAYATYVAALDAESAAAAQLEQWLSAAR
jgi:hypothetical protein